MDVVLQEDKGQHVNLTFDIVSPATTSGQVRTTVTLTPDVILITPINNTFIFQADPNNNGTGIDIESKGASS